MCALIHHLAASGPLRVGAPLVLQTGPPAVPVARLRVQEPADASRAGDVQRLMHAGRMTVVESEGEQPARALGAIPHRLRLRDIPAGRLLAQDVFAGLEGRAGDGCEPIVGGGDDDPVHVACTHRILPARECSRSCLSRRTASMRPGLASTIPTSSASGLSRSTRARRDSIRPSPTTATRKGVPFQRLTVP